MPILCMYRCTCTFSICLPWRVTKQSKHVEPVGTSFYLFCKQKSSFVKNRTILKLFQFIRLKRNINTVTQDNYDIWLTKAKGTLDNFSYYQLVMLIYFSLWRDVMPSQCCIQCVTPYIAYAITPPQHCHLKVTATRLICFYSKMVKTSWHSEHYGEQATS